MASLTKRIMVQCTGRGILMFALVIMAIMTYTFVRFFMNTPSEAGRVAALTNYRTTTREGELKRQLENEAKVNKAKVDKIKSAIEHTTQTTRQKLPEEPPKAVKPIEPPKDIKPVEEKPIETSKKEKQVDQPKEEKPVEAPKVESPKQEKPVESPKEEKPLESRKEEKPVESRKEEKPVESPKEEKPEESRKEEKPVESPKQENSVEESSPGKEKSVEPPKEKKPVEAPISPAEKQSSVPDSQKERKQDDLVKQESSQKETPMEPARKEKVEETPKQEKQEAPLKDETSKKQDEKVEPTRDDKQAEIVMSKENQNNNKEQIEDNFPVETQGDISLNPNDAQTVVRKLQKTGNTMLDVFLADKPRKNNDLSSWVHLDLKGAAPSIEYLIQLVPLLKKWGATGLLIEYEDMFPWRSELEILKATNAYSISSLKLFLKVVKENDLEAVPLIQTLGHLEFLLKHASFQRLRENQKYPAFLNPGLDDSLSVIKMMIDQVMDIHSDSTYIHIGCDEVYVLGTSKETQQKMSQNNYNVAQLYLRHIQTLAEFSKSKYNVQTLVWDDMMRKMPTEELKVSNIGSHVEPVIWNYNKIVSDVITDDIWDKYAAIFTNVWVASAFKGASGSVQHLPELSIHLQNHANWMEVVEELKHTHPKMNVKGFILTGWSRYDHFSALCDLLPASIPSLVACLQIIKTGTWNTDVIQEVSSLLQCTGPVFALNPETLHFSYVFEIPTTQDVIKSDRQKQCSFPGDDIFNIILLYHQALQTFERYFDPITGETRGQCNRFSLGHSFVNPFGVEMLCTSAAEKVLKVFNVVDERVPVIFRTIYDDSVANEWLEEHVIAFESWLQQYKSSIKTAASKSPVWGERPGNFLDNKNNDLGFPVVGA